MMSDTPERWIEETTYIVKEMFYAIEQGKICEPDRVKAWVNRAEYLRDRAKLCITNAFNDVVTGDNDDTSHQTVSSCYECENAFDECEYFPFKCVVCEKEFCKECGAYQRDDNDEWIFDSPACFDCLLIHRRYQVVKCDRCGGIRKPDFFMPCVCKNPTHPELVESEEE